MKFKQFSTLCVYTITELSLSLSLMNHCLCKIKKKEKEIFFTIFTGNTLQKNKARIPLVKQKKQQSESFEKEKSSRVF